MRTNDKKIILIKYVQLLFYTLLSGLFLLLSNNVVGDIIAFIILVFGAMSIVRFDLAHPYVWFSFVFMLYSISYPIFYLNGILYDVYLYTKSLMFSQWLALLIFLFVVGPIKVYYSKLKKPNMKFISSKIFLTLTSIILMISIIQIITGGYSHKNDIYEGSAFVSSIGFRAALVFLILYAINLSKFALEKNKIDKKLSFYVFINIFLLVFFSGERDLIIRFFVITLFIYYIIVKKSKLSKEIIILGVVSLSLIPILAKFKYFGLTGETTESELNFFLSFLSSDFLSASKNLQILLLDESANGIFLGATFVSAFIRALNLDVFLGMKSISAGGWYNDKYFAEGRSGQGFTIVGDGFVNFGYLGIIVLFIFIGILVKFLYKRSNKGIYSFVFYILSIPVFMYSIRADLTNILSPLIQQNLLTIFVLKLLLEILYKPESINKKSFISGGVRGENHK